MICIVCSVGNWHIGILFLWERKWKSCYNKLGWVHPGEDHQDFTTDFRRFYHVRSLAFGSQWYYQDVTTPYMARDTLHLLKRFITIPSFSMEQNSLKPLTHQINSTRCLHLGSAQGNLFWEQSPTTIAELL